MARIEKTVFISYRRKDISWALTVYQYLTSQKYDVFFDYTSLPSGDFEQIIVSNIRARAHFVLILTPTALDRADKPGDWLRREIEAAIDEKRNIIPLFFDGFSFGSPSVAEKLSGKLSALQRYNGLDIPSGYFMEAMRRLRSRYLNIPLDAVIHPISTEVRKVVGEEKVAADKALEQKKEIIKELVKPAEDKPLEQKQAPSKGSAQFPPPNRREERDKIKFPKFRPYGIGAGILLIATIGILIATLGIFGINRLIQNALGIESPIPTLDSTNPALPTNEPGVPTGQNELAVNGSEGTPSGGLRVYCENAGPGNVDIPAGSFEGTLTIQITCLSPEEIQRLIDTLQITTGQTDQFLSAIKLNPSGTRFDSFVTITIPLLRRVDETEGDVVDVYVFQDDNSSAFEKIVAQVSDECNRWCAKAIVDHFSTFVAYQ